MERREQYRAAAAAAQAAAAAKGRSAYYENGDVHLCVVHELVGFQLYGQDDDDDACYLVRGEYGSIWDEPEANLMDTCWVSEHELFDAAGAHAWLKPHDVIWL